MSAHPPEADPILTHTRGDRAAAERLRRSLVAIRDHLGNEALSARIDTVLNGGGSVRQLVRDPVMVSELGRAMQRFSEQWFAMSPAERAELAREGQRQDGLLRTEIGLGPDSDPAPVGEFGPALTEPHPVD